MTPDDMIFTIEIDDGEPVGLVSDTHFGSKFQQITYLRDFYDHMEKLGVKQVFHCGDLTAGCNVYKGQKHENFTSTFDDIVAYVEKNYPKKDGMTTRFIVGNHDDSWYKVGGSDIGIRVSERREDLEYLGRYGAYVNMNGAKVYLYHPQGLGIPYAISYPVQKAIERFSSENKPKLFLVGHFHIRASFEIRNVDVVMVPCFESQTPYERSKTLMPTVAGMVLWPTIVDGSIVDLKEMRRTYFVTKTKDY
jgi:predicted phosphodiesterase